MRLAEDVPRRIRVAAPAEARPWLEGDLPADAEISWFDTADEAIRLAPHVEVGWFDIATGDQLSVIAAARSLRWLSSVAAGLDHLPLADLHDRKVIMTNGVGLHAVSVAEYAVMGVLAAAKGFHKVVLAQQRHEWLQNPPGSIELSGSKALIIGYGSIGRAIGDRLNVLGVHVTGVRSKSDPDIGILGPDDWRSRVGDHDWIIVAAPATRATAALIDATIFAAMKKGAWLVNVARGALVDRDALMAALAGDRLGGAFLDVTDPEPLAADDPLWDQPNAIVTMHLSGRSQGQLFERGARLFLSNLRRYAAGERLENQVDLLRGY